MGLTGTSRLLGATGEHVQGLCFDPDLRQIGSGDADASEPLVSDLVDWAANAFGLADIAEGGEAPRAALGRTILRQLGYTGRRQPPAPHEGVSRARRGPGPLVGLVRPPVRRLG